MEFWCVCILLPTLVTVTSASTWSYTGEHGPAHWKDMTNSKCGMSKQSPIDIEIGKVKNTNSLSAFRLYNFDKAINATLSNNGHSAQVTLQGNTYVEGGGLSGKYKPLQFHFHWGSNDSLGSEHTLNGERFPLEMHIVTMKESYSNPGLALNKFDGFAVLGFFFEVTTTNNNGFDSVINNLEKIKDVDSSTPLLNIKLEDFLASNLTTFYRYDGSLTTPDCNEAVVWTLFTEKIKISATQLAKYRALFSHDMDGTSHAHLTNNFRPVQNLGDRTVYLRAAVSSNSRVLLPLLSLIPSFLISVLVHMC